MTSRPFVALATLALASCGGDSPADPVDEEGTVCEDALCDRAALDDLGMHTFYQKYLDAGGVPVISSEHVEDEALMIGREIVLNMLSVRVDVLQEMVENGAYVGIMSRDEVTTDIPEHAHLANDPNTDWDQRARGLGGTLSNPITTAGEENLLCLAVDRYDGENILVHEFAHGIHGIGIAALESGFNAELRAAYEEALAAGLWEDTYAATNPGEYFAEGVQSWFDTNQDPQAGIHNEVDTRAELREYDPALGGIVERYFGDGEWRPTCPGEA